MFWNPKSMYFVANSKGASTLVDLFGENWRTCFQPKINFVVA